MQENFNSLGFSFSMHLGQTWQLPLKYSLYSESTFWK